MNTATLAVWPNSPNSWAGNSRGEPAYRLKQAKSALFRTLIESWKEADNLPLALRQRLENEFPMGIKAKTFISKDREAVRALLDLSDGLKVETVLMLHKDRRNTVCVSSQVGCPLGCLFCATGKLGFKRNLSAWEIVSQVLFFSRYLKKLRQKITNIVFMGMGEPFLNYDNVISAIKILNDKDGFNLGSRRFSISTSGITDGIEKLAEEKLQINLAISLHAPNDELRSKIIPVNKKYPIRKILGAVDDYIDKTKRRVMFEYIMIKDFNDSDAMALELAKLMKKPLYLVNLISYNPTGTFKPSSPQRTKKFMEILERKGVAVTKRHAFGQDIRAACGQLSNMITYSND